VEVIVQLRPSSSQKDMHALGEMAPPRVFRNLEEEYGVTLQPLHPGAQDAALCRYYTLTITDEAVAPEVLARLRRSTRVEAAYVKPADEAPLP
jgi:hypothetical protein